MFLLNPNEVQWYNEALAGNLWIASEKNTISACVYTCTCKTQAPPVLIIHRFIVIQMNLDHAMEVAVYSQVPEMETNEQFMAMR